MKNVYVVIGSSGLVRGYFGLPPSKYDPSEVTDEQALEMAREKLASPSRLAGSRIVRASFDMDNPVVVKTENTPEPADEEATDPDDE